MLRCHVVAAHIPGATGFGRGVLLSAGFRGVPRRTQVVPEERSLSWNEELVWPLDTCPLGVTDTLSLRLRRWDSPVPPGDLGATTVSLAPLVAEPGVPLACRDMALLDRQELPTGCTVTFCCYHDPHGMAGDIAVTTQGQVALEPPQCPSMAPAGRKEDFQVRVRVIKGRQLRGRDIRPVVKVLIGKGQFRTQSRSGNNPYFNEVFCQNFHQTPEQLVAQPIRIQVLRSPNICTKPVIGVFELDVGTVYSAPGRSLSWRWVSLRHPRYGSSSSQGFLQLSLAVRRAGERAQEQEKPPGDEDVAANLLRPPRCATTLLVRVFRGDSLPLAEPRRRCLSGSKGSETVAVRVGFGGRTLCTRAVPFATSPEWNEVLFFPLRLPPICDEIRLEILRGSCRSHVVARATLRLSQLCWGDAELEGGAPGSLPCFGPCLLPCYGPRAGCPRDSGLVFGGRLLLELCARRGSPSRRQREAIAAVDMEGTQSHLPRCRLGLCGVFHSATMLPGGTEALRLELGMGSAAATTALALPVTHGNLYHHLPWFGDKPVVAVTSLWEDAGHRWDSLNLLRALCRRLERNVAELQCCHGDTARDIGTRLLRELVQDCEEALAWLDTQPTPTALDQQLRSSRLQLLRQLCDTARGQLCHTAQRQPCHTARGQLCHTARGQHCHTAQGQLCHTARGQLCHTARGQHCHTAQGQHCHTARGQLCHTARGQHCHTAQGQHCHTAQGQHCHTAQGQYCHTAQGQLRHTARGQPQPPPLRWDTLGTVALGWLRRLAALAVEPQLGVPDVQLWLLRGQRGVASVRVPAGDILHSPRGQRACGHLCGRIQTLFLGCGDVHAQVRVRLWLGRVCDSGDLERLLEGTLRFYCETYENQTRLLGHWAPRKLLGRPAFSDGCGRAVPPPASILPPRGWRWDGAWSVERPRRAMALGDAAVSAVLEELYENQRRDCSGSWSASGTASTDAKGVAVPPKEEVACPQGWRVTSEWHVDMAGAVDKDGWEYGVGTEDGSPPAVWHDKGQHCHTLRRRRWVRVRHRDTDSGTREQDMDTASPLPEPEELWEDEAWQPECFWGCSCQPKVPAGPWCRRRRWHRSLVPAEPTAVSPLFLLQGFPDTEDPAQQNNPAVAPQVLGGSSRTLLQQPAPFILCSFQRPSHFQLRCYIFQALGLSPSSARTSIDATAHVWFVSLSQRTRAVRGALDPQWEQTLLFPRVLLFGDPRGVQEDPPAVVVEVFDQRGQGSGVFLGRAVCLPAVWLDAALREPPRLQPHPLRGPRGPAGELLAAFELLHEPEEGSLALLSPPPLKKDGFGIPPELRPRLQRVALEVLAWGLRGLRGAVREPRLELQWGEQSLCTPPLGNIAANPNFPSNAFVLTLALPEEERLVPPIRLRLWDRAERERRALLGQASVRELRPFRCPPPRREQLLGAGSRGKDSFIVVSMPEELLSLPVTASLWKRWCSRFVITAPARMAQALLDFFRSARAADKEEEEEEEEEERDWWSKFYASMEDKDRRSSRGANRDRLTIYSCELEAVPEFEGLQDFCQTFPLYKPGRPLPGQDPEPVADFKGLFRIYPLPEEPAVSPEEPAVSPEELTVSPEELAVSPEELAVSPAPRCFQRLPPSEPQQCLVRVYIVRALDLSPRDVTGLSDPYVRVSLGKRTLGHRDQYVPNTLEPVFGRMFELTATIPLEKDLRVTIMDHDKVPPDQEIGSTTIDLENRLLSSFRAHCGLPRLYRTGGPACWRDQLCPSRVLEVLCGSRGLPAPRYTRHGTALSLGGQRFLLRSFESGPPAFRHPGPPRERLALHVLNRCGFVPEHLESRSLQSSAQPGLEQGKVQMWVDIFPTSLGPPGPPVNIDPRKAEGYELRCVVWRVKDTDLADVNLLGQRMSDIYVSGWLDGLAEQRQHTDIHYRSRDGNGSFNWRFVFPFEFLAAEKLCTVRHKAHVWSLDETELKVPPKLILQVWDNDKFKADDLLGTLELELTQLARPAPSPRLCRLSPPELSRFPWPWRRAPRRHRAPLDLFRRRRAHGWWPCAMQEDSGQRLSGKVELSLELLPAQEAEERPVGKGREEPNRDPTLPPPRRPKSSFLWLQNPLKMVRHGIRWRYLLWLGLALAALMLLFLVHSFFPGSLTVKVADSRQLLRHSGNQHPSTEPSPGGKHRP